MVDNKKSRRLRRIPVKEWIAATVVWWLCLVVFPALVGPVSTIMGITIGIGLYTIAFGATLIRSGHKTAEAETLRTPARRWQP